MSADYDWKHLAQDLQAEHPGITRAKAIVKRQRSSGDALTPVLQLQDRCDEAERERKKLQLDLIDRTRQWQWKVTLAEKAREEENEKLRRLWRKATDHVREERQARLEAEAKAAAAITWVLPPMNLEYNQPDNDDAANNNRHSQQQGSSDEPYDYYDHPDDDHAAEEYTFRDWLIDNVPDKRSNY